MKSEEGGEFEKILHLRYWDIKVKCLLSGGRGWLCLAGPIFINLYTTVITSSY